MIFIFHQDGVTTCQAWLVFKQQLNFIPDVLQCLFERMAKSSLVSEIQRYRTKCHSMASVCHLSFRASE